MSVSTQTRLCVQAHVVFAQVGEEAVLLNTESGRYFGLDAIGSRVWLSLTGTATEEQICAELLEEYAVDPGVLRTDIRRLLDQLAQSGLITSVDAVTV